MGVPVVTLAGKVHAQLVSYSILKNIGVEETIAGTEAEYVAIAVNLGRDLEVLGRLRARIPGAVRGSILCDPVRFTRQIEQLFLQAWEEKSRFLLQGATGIGPARPGLWVDHIQYKPYAQNLLPAWMRYLEKQAGTEHWQRHQEAMDLYFEAQAEDIAGRRMKLAGAYRLLSRLRPEQAGWSVAQTFLRIAIELGEIEQSSAMLQGLIERLIGQESIDLPEPFLPVLADYERIACHGELKWWLLASLLELRDRLLAGSAAYADDEAMQVLELLRRLGYGTPYVEDRCRGIQARRAGDTAATCVATAGMSEARESEAGSMPLAVARPARAPQERPIRVLHNLGRSGGTLISRCLACMQDIVLLSEIHPKGSERFNPLAQAQAWFRLFDEQELRRIHNAGRLNFLQQLDLIEQRCHELGKYLVVRDWAHVDFHAVPFTAQACYELTTANVLEFSGLFHLARMAVTRHPIDQWHSLSRLTFMRERLSLADFLYGYRRYAEQCSCLGFLRYEDFVAHPEDSMKSLCRSLELPYDSRFIHVWPDYDKITGDVGVGPVKREIKPAGRRELAPVQLDRFAENTDYQAALALLGYQHPQ
jgi:hypothetical protein